MKRKTTFFLLAAVIPTLTVNGQSIKDYFIPDSQFNKATFYSPSKTGERTEETRTIYYVNKGATYEIMDAKMFKGTPLSIVTETVVLTQTEVKMTKSVLTNIMETNKKQYYNPPRTILKIPIAGQTVRYTDIPGTHGQKCIASWTTVTIDGVTKKAIKVISIPNNPEDAKDFGKTIEYYVKGIGLWKSEAQASDGETIIFDEFDQLENDPTAK